MKVLHVIGLWLSLWVAVLSLGVVLIVAGAVNVGLSGLAWPFAQAQGWAARRVRAIR
jgi:hypothetical protein